MKKIKIYILFLFIFPNILFSQNRVEISAGLSIPELLNFKIKYGNNFQIGGSLGYMPYVSFWAISGDIYYHFPSKSNEDKSRKWFLNTGISYIPPSESFSSTSKKTLLMYSRIGKTFYSHNKNNLTGLCLELGIMFQIWTNEKYSYSYGTPILGRPMGSTRTITENSPIIGPALNISYFFKL
jgi:hypothetical protein